MLVAAVVATVIAIVTVIAIITVIAKIIPRNYLALSGPKRFKKTYSLDFLNCFYILFCKFWFSCGSISTILG